MNGDADKMQEHNQYVSFDTQVKCIAEQWNEDNVKRYEKIIRDHHAAQKLQQWEAASSIFFDLINKLPTFIS